MNVVKYIPPTEPECGLMTWASVAPPSLLNLCVRIDLLEQIKEELFIKAVQLTVERLPYCRYRMHDMPDGSFCQYESSLEQQVACELYDFSDYSEKKLSSTLSKWAGEPFPNKIRDTQLYRFRLIRLANGKHCFFLCGHHIIMDIYAVVFTGNYIAKVYDALLNHTELPLPGADPESVVAKQNEFYASEKMEKQRQWWRDQFAAEPRFTSINGIGSKEFVKGKRYGKDRGITQMKSKEYEYRIPKELADSINEQASKHNFSPYLYYISALRTYLAQVNCTEDVEFMSLITHRATLAEKSSGLDRAVGVPFRSIIGADTSFAASLEQLNVLHRDYMKRLGMSDPCLFVEQYHNVPQGMRYYSVMFSYAPFIDFSQIPLKIKATKIDAGISLAPLYILIIPTEQSGEISAFYQIAKGYVKPKCVEKFHAFMLKFLEMGIANPDMTIRELTDRCI